MLGAEGTRNTKTPNPEPYTLQVYPTLYKPVVGVGYHAGRPLTMSTKAHARRASQLAGGGLMRKLVKQVLFNLTESVYEVVLQKTIPA